jgi:hypothetical protein
VDRRVDPEGAKGRLGRHVAVVVATAVNQEGKREIGGIDVVTTEDTASWTELLRSLVAHGLCGVEPVVSVAHGGPPPPPRDDTVISPGQNTSRRFAGKASVAVWAAGRVRRGGTDWWPERMGSRHPHGFWEERADAAFATLMRVVDVRELPDVHIPKRDRRG